LGVDQLRQISNIHGIAYMLSTIRPQNANNVEIRLC
jgi:hypothetical protein